MIYFNFVFLTVDFEEFAAEEHTSEETSAQASDLMEQLNENGTDFHDNTATTSEQINNDEVGGKTHAATSESAQDGISENGADDVTETAPDSKTVEAEQNTAVDGARKDDDMRTSNNMDDFNFMLDDDYNMLDEEMIYEDGTTNRSNQVSSQLSTFVTGILGV